MGATTQLHRDDTALQELGPATFIINEENVPTDLSMSQSDEDNSSVDFPLR